MVALSRPTCWERRHKGMTLAHTMGMLGSLSRIHDSYIASAADDISSRGGGAYRKQSVATDSDADFVAHSAV